MTATALSKPVTADELLDMGDIGPCELIHGELIMMSFHPIEHGYLALRLGAPVASFVHENGIGAAFATGTGYRMDYDLVRAPDISVVRRERFANGIPSKGFIHGPPDLAVEVVSPYESRRYVAEKVAMWISKGCSSCWVVWPNTRTIEIHRPGGFVQILSEGETLADDPVLPGFSFEVSELFRPAF